MKVLLDTMVAKGLVGDWYEKPKQQEANQNTQWDECIKRLMVGQEPMTLAIPTPVFFELASRDEGLFKRYQAAYLAKNSSLLFSYCDYSITPRMMWKAAELRAEPRQKTPSFVDALLGAYCLLEGYSLITCNQKDFSPQYFEVKSMTLAPMPQKTSERIVVFLLAPKKVSA